MNTFSDWLYKVGASRWASLALFLVLSFSLMLADHRLHYLERVRGGLTALVYPLQLAAGFPTRAGSWVMDFFRRDTAVLQDNEQLKLERLLLLARLQKFEALEAENEHLRGLLGAAAHVADRALVAELVEVSLEPFSQQIMLDRGTADGVYAGQPVIDADGIMGQVSRVTPVNAVVTLITDPAHAIPVQVKRNGLRAILVGTGAPETLELPHLTSIADIQKGDVLLSSGLGGGFPAGYPVAIVTGIISDPNEAFLKVAAKPVAQLDHSKQMLLIWPGAPKAREAGHAGK